MFRHELSTFLQAVLDAVGRRGSLQIDRYDDPDPTFVISMANDLAAEPDEVRLALSGLRACHCLIEDALEIPGAEPVVHWRVHPQCLPEPSGSAPLHCWSG